MMIALLFTAAAAPLTITTISGDLAADEIWILELDEDGSVRRGPTLEDVIDSSFDWDDTDWVASTAALAAFHRELAELGESQTHTSADVGHILGTDDGARSCACPQGCASGDCEFSVEVASLFSASLQCTGTCSADPCSTEATDAGGDEGQTADPSEGPIVSDDETFGGVQQPPPSCDGACEEDVMSTTDPGYTEEINRLLNLWSGGGRGPNASEPCD